MNTFAQLRQFAITRYQDLIKTQDEVEQTYNKMLGKNIYSADYLKKIKADGEAEVSKVRLSIAADLEAMVKLAITEKRTALNKMLAEAPTADQMNLLNSLQLQVDTVTADEVSSIALQLTGNYRAFMPFR